MGDMGFALTLRIKMRSSRRIKREFSLIFSYIITVFFISLYYYHVALPVQKPCFAACNHALRLVKPRFAACNHACRQRDSTDYFPRDLLKKSTIFLRFSSEYILNPWPPSGSKMQSMPLTFLSERQSHSSFPWQQGTTLSFSP